MSRVPHLISAKPLPRGEELRCWIEDYRGHPFLHIRKFYRAPSGEMMPAKGLTVRADVIPWLHRALALAESRALEMGLLDEEAFESAGLPLPTALGG